MSRHSDAIAIQGGACNPIAIINSLTRAIEEIGAEVGGISPPTETVTGDPAVRLMVHQLAYICLANDHFCQIGPEYSGLAAACEEKVEQLKGNRENK